MPRRARARSPLDVQRDCIDLLSLTAHKMHGPKGIGALCMRREPRARPRAAAVRRRAGARSALGHAADAPDRGHGRGLSARARRKCSRTWRASPRCASGCGARLSYCRACNLNGRPERRVRGHPQRHDRRRRGREPAVRAARPGRFVGLGLRDGDRRAVVRAARARVAATGWRRVRCASASAASRRRRRSSTPRGASRRKSNACAPVRRDSFGRARRASLEPRDPAKRRSAVLPEVLRRFRVTRRGRRTRARAPTSSMASRATGSRAPRSNSSPTARRGTSARPRSSPSAARTCSRRPPGSPSAWSGSTASNSPPGTGRKRPRRSAPAGQICALAHASGRARDLARNWPVGTRSTV